MQVMQPQIGIRVKNLIFGVLAHSPAFITQDVWDLVG